MKPITIVDYGMANLRSVQKAFEQLGHQAIITGDPNAVAEADRLVLPGVGAFQDAIARLRETGLDAAIGDHVRGGRPFLGICLGLQMLFTRSFEDGEHRGLDLFAGDVVRFPHTPGLKVPHMGWNQLRVRSPAPHLADLPPDSAVYFVHSYYVAPEDPTVAAGMTEYGVTFPSVLIQDNVLGTQFHPEKSGDVGLRLYDNFVRLCAAHGATAHSAPRW